jgi:hypothetical protein
LLDKCSPEEGVEWFVLDFTEAFWQVPLDPAERRFFCAMLDTAGVRQYLVFLRTVQGSRSAPLTWARVAALVMRLTQSLFHPDTLRLHCFVDDPIASVRGTAAERRAAVATMVLVWEALSFGLAYKKGQFGKKVVWIGGTLEFTASGLDAAVKDTIVEDIVTGFKAYSASNIVSRKELLSFVGRLNHAAGLLVTLRPFLHALWAALSSANTGPTNTIWTKQIEHALSWLRAFFCTEILGISRHFSLEQFRGVGPCIEIGTDASPWGLGGWYAIDHTIVKHFYCRSTTKTFKSSASNAVRVQASKC